MNQSFRAPQDGLVELNTFFLIARRQWRGLRQPLRRVVRGALTRVWWVGATLLTLQALRQIG